MRNISTTSVNSTLNRSIFFFYEKALRYVPILLMLCHWYGVYSFHDNPREIVIDIRENEECIAYLYFMVYIFPVVFMLPASHFFKLCWIWRIPFVYIIGTNAIRIYYRSLVHNQRNVRCRLHTHNHDLGSVCLCLRADDMSLFPSQIKRLTLKPNSYECTKLTR